MREKFYFKFNGMDATLEITDENDVYFGFCEDCEYYNKKRYCKMGLKTSLTVKKIKCNCKTHNLVYNI